MTIWKLNRLRREGDREQLMAFITTIPDDFTRKIFALRFLSDLTWRQVAAKLGGVNDENNVSLICYRYLAKLDGNMPENCGNI